MTTYTPTIGLEIHAELNTKTKMFCGCKNDPFCKEPNKYICPVCLGLPGSLPVANKQAVIDTILIGQAIEGTIAPITKWDRKHYFYPDLPKGYQISQYDIPLVSGGYINIEGQKVNITRVHLEEDTGKLNHKSGSDTSLVDLNRAGVPLVELVTQPDIHDGKTARKFAEEYQLILRSLGVSNADMEKGEMRVEVNISLSQNSEFGTKVEIKNLNSFRAVERSIEYEIQRQTELLEKGEKIVQETRGYNLDRGTTVSQRVKETSADYRYFPEPDLPIVNTSKLDIPKLSLLPGKLRNNLIKKGINAIDAQIIITNTRLRNFVDGLTESDWENKDFASAVKLLIQKPELIDKHDFNFYLEAAQNGGMTALKRYLETGSFKLIEMESNNLEEIVTKVINDNSGPKKSFQSGLFTLEKTIGAYMGPIMRETRGRASHDTVTKLIQERIQH